jgi:uncharacterized protein Veg
MEESKSFQAEQWFGKNWKFIAWGLMVTILVMCAQQFYIADRMSSLEATVAENNGKVVLTTTDGRAVKVTKTPLKAEYLKQFAVSAYVNNFIVSRSQLTEGFSKNSFVKYSDILQTSPFLKMVFDEFIDKNDKIALGDFTSYLQWILSAIGQDKLPEYITLRNYTVPQYEFKDNTFVLTIDIDVIAQSYMLAQAKYVTQKGTVRIVSQGTFNLELSSDNNPYGMRISRFHIAMITKGAK